MMVDTSAKLDNSKLRAYDPPSKHGRRLKHGCTDACAATVDRPRLSPQFFASGLQKCCEVCTLDLEKYVFYNS